MSVKSKSAADLMSRTRAMASELEEGIRTLREEIASLQDSRHDVEVRPVVLEEALANVDDWAKGLGQDAGRNMSISFDSFAMPPGRSSLAGSRFHELAGEVLLMFIYPVLAEHLKIGVTAHYETVGNAISAADRAKEIARLDRRILDCEMSEEAIIRVAEASGFPVLRRSGANPAAVLADDSELA